MTKGILLLVQFLQLINLIVTGVDNGSEELKSVEQNDYYKNKWTFLPDIIHERSWHTAVSMGNKMFIIGGYKTVSCELLMTVILKNSQYRIIH